MRTCVFILNKCIATFGQNFKISITTTFAFPRYTANVQFFSLVGKKLLRCSLKVHLNKHSSLSIICLLLFGYKICHFFILKIYGPYFFIVLSLAKALSQKFQRQKYLQYYGMVVTTVNFL